MSDADWGKVFSLLAALSWSAGVVLFKRSTDEVGAVALNLFKNTIALALFFLTILIQNVPLAAIRAAPTNDLLILALSGVIGIAIADTIFFFALDRIGVGLTSIVDCLYSPFAILFAWLLLSEQLHAMHYVGGALIVSAVLLATGARPPPNRTARDLTLGIGAVVLSVALMAFGIVIAKPPLERLQPADIPWATTLRLLAGTLFLLLLVPWLPGRAEVWRVFRPRSVWRFSVPAAVIGTYFCLLCWVAGFKYEQAGIAALLNQTSVMFSILLAAVFLREPITRRKALAVGLALAGIVTLQAGPPLWERWLGGPPAI